jgi:hypothetical protein
MLLSIEIDREVVDGLGAEFVAGSANVCLS